MGKLGCSCSVALSAGALLLAGCGGGDDAGGSGAGGFSADTTCGMSLVVSGAFSETIPNQSSIACATTLSSDAGIDSGFLTTEGEAVHTVELAIADVKKDETGSGFPATLRVRHTDQRSWTASDCVAEVLTHAYQHADEMFDFHRIAGTVGCAAPATSDAGTDTDLTIESFAFVCTVPWTR